MLKELGIVAGGIFIGAVAAEVVRKTRPDRLDTLYARAGELTCAAKKAFMEGYRGALSTQTPSPTEA